MTQAELTPREWYDEAVRCYTENHQGCPWCGSAHGVYHSQRNRVIEYYCGSCEFFASHDEKNDRFFSGPGHTNQAQITMYAI
jgi:hypothetical protein